MATYPRTPTLIDWLSISGTTSGYSLKTFDIIKLDFGTSVFATIEEVYQNKERIATITSKPYSSIIREDLHIIKFDNWVLYSNDFIKLYSTLVFELNLEKVGISRIDLARDFNTFLNKRKPDKLIKDFLSGSVVKLGKSKYSVWGETNKVLTYDYLSFGKKSSKVNVYLYNKSTELNQVKNKPHIRHKWQEYNLNENEPVFRLEISIKQKDIDMINKSSGEVVKFDITKIFLQEEIEKLYKLLLNKYFHFKKFTNQKNVTREEDIILFKDCTFDNIIWEPVKSLESNRSDKIFLKKLDTMYSELRTDDLQLFDAIEKLRDVFTNRKNLTGYLYDKITPSTKLMLEHPSYFAPELKKNALLFETFQDEDSERW